MRQSDPEWARDVDRPDPGAVPDDCERHARRPVCIERVDVGWRLTCDQWVAQPPALVFPFFASPYNLERLTPPFLRFRITSASDREIRAGTVITYRLRLHGLPVLWRTRIDRWEAPREFVDRQVLGPFRRWSHRHEFLPVDGGTLMRDTVRFDLYCRRLHSTPLLAWIDGDLRRIFEHRRRAVADRFGAERPPRTDRGERK